MPRTLPQYTFLEPETGLSHFGVFLPHKLFIYLKGEKKGEGAEGEGRREKGRAYFGSHLEGRWGGTDWSQMASRGEEYCLGTKIIKHRRICKPAAETRVLPWVAQDRIKLGIYTMRGNNPKLYTCPGILLFWILDLFILRKNYTSWLVFRVLCFVLQIKFNPCVLVALHLCSVWTSGKYSREHGPLQVWYLQMRLFC